MTKTRLHQIYDKYHNPAWLKLDPLLCVRRYDDPRQREIVGLLASVLAYGRVENIIRNIDRILTIANGDLFSFLHSTSLREKKDLLSGFRHRFNTGADIAVLLQSAACIVDKYGSLENLFSRKCCSTADSILEAASGFVVEFKQMARKTRAKAGTYFDYLLPSPTRGSACKRLNMYLRWMIRPDDGIDCGVWGNVSPRVLIMPVDAHVAKVSRVLKLTDRKSADWRMAEQITQNLKKVSPEDPVKYDFSICRYGMMLFREGLKE